MIGVVCFVPGTHERGGPGQAQWWHRGQPMARAAETIGWHVTAMPWTTELDGVLGPSRRWRDAGEKLALWLHAHPARAVVAHSHGGNLVPIAVLTDRDVTIPALLTLGTPVRAELDVLYHRMMLTGRVGRWGHVWAAGDGWQWWGSRPPITSWWRPSAWSTTRTMRWATENRAAGPVGHAGLHTPATFDRLGLWAWLAGNGAVVP